MVSKDGQAVQSAINESSGDPKARPAMKDEASMVYRRQNVPKVWMLWRGM